MTRDLLALLSKHYRFHYNVTYSFWQYCAMSEQRASFPGRGAVPGAKCRTAEAKYSSVVWSPAATFTDLLFASVLRPASTEPFYSSAQNPLDRSSVFPEVCVLRWFTRQPLVERQVTIVCCFTYQCVALTISDTIRYVYCYVGRAQ